LYVPTQLGCSFCSPHTAEQQLTHLFIRFSPDILCGDYTPSANISRFLSEAEALGFTTGPLPISSAWEGSLPVKGLAGPEVESREDGWKETLTARKKRVTGFWLGWKVECRRQDE
jgi:hypothetical protein